MAKEKDLQILITSQMYYEDRQKTVFQLTPRHLLKSRFAFYVQKYEMLMLTVMAKSSNKSIRDFIKERDIEMVARELITRTYVGEYSVYLKDKLNDVVHIYINEGGYTI